MVVHRLAHIAQLVELFLQFALLGGNGLQFLLVLIGVSVEVEAHTVALLVLQRAVLIGQFFHLGAEISLEGCHQTVVALLHGFLVDGGLGHMAVGHDGALFVDEEARATERLALALDVVVVRRQVLKASVVVYSCEIQGVAVGQLHGVVILVEDQYDPRLVLVEQVLWGAFAATHQCEERGNEENRFFHGIISPILV